MIVSCQYDLKCVLRLEFAGGVYCPMEMYRSLQIMLQPLLVCHLSTPEITKSSKTFSGFCLGKNFWLPLDWNRWLMLRNTELGSWPMWLKLYA